MISGQSQATLRRPQRRDSTSSEHDAATLSASLRDLAIRAHRLIRGGPGSGWGQTLETTAELSSEAEQALTEVHAQIVQLQRRLRAQNLHELAAFVYALRQRVEGRLA
jgi:hypothetical protein